MVIPGGRIEEADIAGARVYVKGRDSRCAPVLENRRGSPILRNLTVNRANHRCLPGTGCPPGCRSLKLRQRPRAGPTRSISLELAFRLEEGSNFGERYDRFSSRPPAPSSGNHRLEPPAGNHQDLWLSNLECLASLASDLPLTSNCVTKRTWALSGSVRSLPDSWVP